MESLWQDKQFDTTFREIGACFNFWPMWNSQGQWRPSWKCHNMWPIRKMLFMHLFNSVQSLTVLNILCTMDVLSCPTRTLMVDSGLAKLSFILGLLDSIWLRCNSTIHIDAPPESHSWFPSYPHQRQTSKWCFKCVFEAFLLTPLGSFSWF